MSNRIVGLLRAILRGYQIVLSPFLGPTCRFAPSCSEYAREALLQHGIARGGWLATRRIARCHPWHPGGHDPVPGVRPARAGTAGAGNQTCRSEA